MQMLGVSLAIGGSALAAVFLAYWWGVAASLGDAELRALGFAAIVFANVAMIHAMRSRDLTIVGLLRKPNAALWWITGGTLGALAAAIYLPPVADIFRFAPLSAGALAVAAGAGVAGIVWYEVYKLLRPRSVRI
jgi:Ca2+-transporting ATPase